MKFDEDENPLPQGWTSNSKAIEDTHHFWADRGIDLSQEEGREALHNMGWFVELLTQWTTNQQEQDHEQNE